MMVLPIGGRYCSMTMVRMGWEGEWRRAKMATAEGEKKRRGEREGKSDSAIAKKGRQMSR